MQYHLNALIVRHAADCIEALEKDLENASGISWSQNGEGRSLLVDDAIASTASGPYGLYDAVT